MHPLVSTSIAVTVAIAYALLGAVCVLLVVAALPGTWILIAAAIVIDLIDRLWLAPGDPLTFHPLTILACIAVAAFGELLEFLLSAAGAKRFGASGRGMLGSVVGGVLGALVGSLVFPIVGTIIGAAVGTAAGAVVGELSTGERALKETAMPATGAVLGRLLGTLAKLPIALAVWTTLAIAAFA